MGVFRRKPREEPELERLLGAYSATRLPPVTHSKVATIKCRRCSKPTVYDARRARPTRCAWCRGIL